MNRRCSITLNDCESQYVFFFLTNVKLPIQPGVNETYNVIKVQDVALLLAYCGAQFL